jgi:DNA-binding NarL/FixJ family response regulator
VAERWRAFLAGGETGGRFQVDGDQGPEWIEFRTRLNYAPGQHLAILRPERRFTAAGGRLSPREREILSLLATGLSARQIARDLVLEPTTVATHLRNARQKLNAKTRAEAVATALRDGEIEL